MCTMLAFKLGAMPTQATPGGTTGNVLRVASSTVWRVLVSDVSLVVLVSFMVFRNTHVTSKS
jgi:hypothetical protein